MQAVDYKKKPYGFEPKEKRIKIKKKLLHLRTTQN